MNQHHEGISLTAGIFLIDKEIMDQLWSVWDEMFKVPEQQERWSGQCCSLVNAANVHVEGLFYLSEAINH